MKILVISKKIIGYGTIIITIIFFSFIIYFLNTQIVTSPIRSDTYFMVHTNQKVVALTFDDGPDPSFTEPILDILKQKQVKATFFVIGENARQYPLLLRRMVTDGHEIGNHSYSHKYGQSRTNDELRQTDQSVYSATHTHTHFYRPPGGFITKNLAEMIKNQGYVVTLWSVDSRDWRRPGVSRIVDNVISKISPGAIVLLHDGGGYRSQTVEALGQIIDFLRSDGYSFVSLTELKAFESNQNNISVSRL